MQSNIEKFYKRSLVERQELIRQFADISEDEMEIYNDLGSLDKDLTESFTENTIGIMEVPLGVATNFLVNGKEGKSVV